MRDPFVLFCAGEDSGDVLGESLVQEATRLGFRARGVGGCRMQAAGLDAVDDYEALPVSGFLDIVPQVFRLKRILAHLEGLLKSEDCVAIACIDYPGFNMKLVRLAERLGKPALYVAPPQVWAWKRGRAKHLRTARLAVLFDFERRVYEKLGCNAQCLRHPFPRVTGTNSNANLLLLPGSRKSQSLRNLPFFAAVASQWHSATLGHAVVLASRESLVEPFIRAIRKAFGQRVPEWISVEVPPMDALARATKLAEYSYALSAPGSASLELARSGVPLVVAGVIEPLTYFIGSRFVKTEFFALPNILLQRGVVPEFFFTRGNACKKANVTAVAVELCKCNTETSRAIADTLDETFVNAKSPEALMLEFLGEFVERDAH